MEKLFSPKFILWDLDGTLTYWASKTIIPRIAFCYMRLLCQKVPFLKGFIATARAYGRVLKNLGPFTNDQLFNQNMVNSLKLSQETVREITRDMLFSQAFDTIICKYIRVIPEAKELVAFIFSSKQAIQVIATNPIMPSSFNRHRLEIAGYKSIWFAHVTGSDFHSGQKKIPKFYRDLLNHLKALPEDCIMIGNDVSKDLIAKEIGIKTFIVENPHTRLDGGPQGIKPDWKGNYQVLKKILEPVI